MTTTNPDVLPLLLPEHHEKIEAACVALRACAFGDDSRATVAHYRNLEHAVLEHMAAEEDLLLPRYTEHAPEDAAEIRAAHARLRQQLYQLGIDSELHAIRLESLDRLLATLREHAAHEDRAMYPWARRVLTPITMRELFDRIRSSLHALAIFAPPREPRAAPAPAPHRRPE